MRLVIYDGSVYGRARDPLEWFPSDTLRVRPGAGPSRVGAPVSSN
jgi:hypothetical protein